MSFKKPIDADIIQNFGADFQLDDGRWYYKDTLGYLGHNGTDFAAQAGTPVYAADEGVVTYEGWGGNHNWMGTAAGICVLLNNGGLYSGYAHLMDTTVNAGDHVEKGQLLGHVGSTGAATGPHLHFEAIPLSPNFHNGYAGRIDAMQFVEDDPVAEPVVEAPVVNEIYPTPPQETSAPDQPTVNEPVVNETPITAPIAQPDMNSSIITPPEAPTVSVIGGTVTNQPIGVEPHVEPTATTDNASADPVGKLLLQVLWQDLTNIVMWLLSHIRRK